MSVFWGPVIYCTVRKYDRKSHLYTLSADTSVFFQNICDHQSIESMVIEQAVHRYKYGLKCEKDTEPCLERHTIVTGVKESCPFSLQVVPACNRCTCPNTAMDKMLLMTMYHSE